MRKGRRKRKHLFVENLEARRVLDSTVVFSELMYDPPGDDESLEWLELHNQMSIDMDISQWSLRGGIDFTFADDTIIPGGGYLVVAADPVGLQAQSGFADAIGPYTGRLNNAGDSVELLNNSNRLMDSLAYGNSGQWPVAPHGSGTTLAKFDALSASPPAENWTASEQLGGTPGELNFLRGEAARVTFDFVQPGETASVLVPTNDGLGTAWTSDSYVEGSQGETWISGPTGVGFLSGSEQISYEDTVLGDDPVAYWRFGETDVAESADNLGLAGDAADGTYAAEAGIGEESLLGEAGDGALRISSTGATTPMQTGAFEKFSEIAGVGGTGRSLELWVSLDSEPSSVASLIGDGESFLDLGMSLYVSADANLQAFVRTTGGTFFGITQIETEAQLTIGQPTHVVATWDRTAGDVKIFLDGWEAATSVVLGAQPNANPPQNTNNSFFVGKDGRNTAAVDAVVDEIAIYNYALEPGQIATHFDIGQPTFANLFQTDIEAQMHNTSSSAYVRLPFEYEGGAALDQLTLPIRYDDGFVAYVNGQEVARRNAPAGGLSFDSVATADRSVGESLTKETIDLSEHIDKIQLGTNVLAIHGLNFDASNNDFLILPELKAAGSLVIAADLPNVVINEVASAQDATFQLELLNTEDVAANLEDYVLVREGAVDAEYVFPATTLPAGGYLALSEAQLGFDVADGDRLFLYGPEKSVLVDARETTNRLRGRSTQHDGRWLYPDAPTFGAANSFSFEDDVVINEIMYHARPEYGSAPITTTAGLVSLNGQWQYEAPAGGLDGLTPAWFDPAFDDGVWSTGQASFGADISEADYFATVMADEPLAYWRLGEANGPTVVDASGNGHNGTADAGVQFNRQGLIAGGGDGALNTVGNSRVTVSAFEKFPPGSTGFTTEYWIKLNAPPTGFNNIVGDGESSGDFYMMNYLTGSGQIRPHFSFANTPVSIDSVTQLAVGQTYHVVTTWDINTGTTNIYINGQLDITGSTSTNVPDNTNNVMYLGKDNREPGGDFDLDEVAFYARALSAAEVAEHFSAGAGTSFTTPVDLGPTTYYFRNEFEFAGDPATAELTLGAQVDDGAVFYLNGTEIHRQNMPAGPITHNTFANSEVGVATVSPEISIPATALVSGTNVLAVEVHQFTSPDNDVSFAASLSATQTIGEDRPFSASDEEWIELYNRGTATVDLTGWKLDEGIEFDFPAGQTIAPDSYLVVARDAAALARKYPAIAGAIIGDFSGQLNNVDENIMLVDANKNPADEVHYYEAGRWSSFADGGSSSLELRDPNADNAVAEAWAASDEGTRSPWVTYTYRGIANNPPGSNNPSTFNEFSFGLLDEGEILIDDIHVIEDPEGAAREFIQNSEFTGTFDRWRPVGNQHGSIVSDPDDPNNDVFHLRATGPEEHLQNRVETTLKHDGSFVSVSRGTEYEISFRAKWLGGSPQLNTRLFFNYVPRTTILAQPAGGGTPGAQNSTYEENVGPTYDDLHHLPVTPAPGEDIAVFVAAADPNGVANLTLWYAVNEGAFASTSMAPTASGRYLGTIPGQASGAVVQFYVEGQDALGATSLFPAAGPDSRALIQVGAGPTSTTGLQNIQIIMLGSEETLLGQSTNLMSNDRLGSTVVYEGRVYYDTGVRLKGSEHGRPDTNRRGYSVEFPPDDLFRGVHRSIGIDRSGGWRFGRTFGQDEILIYQFFNRAGGFPSMYNDLIFVDGPTLAASTAILQLARYTDTFLESQFENGAEGTRYEYELIYTMVPSGGVEGLKAAQEGPSVFGIPVGRDMGDDKEAYRHNFLIKNNLDQDDYSGMIELAKTFSLSGDAFHEATQELLDVDEWLRSFAALSLSGANDNYNAGSQHNAIFYQRPSDGRMLLFPFDMDFAFHLSSGAPLSSNGDLNKLISLPDNEHAFYGHLHDIISTSFNTEYMSDWVTHFDDLLPNQNLGDILTWIGQRHDTVLNRLPPELPFELFGEPPTVTVTTLLGENAPATALVPSVDNGGDQLANTWTQVDFVETADWVSGTTGVGYETAPADYAGLLNLDVSDMFETNQSVFVRMPFEFNGDTSTFDNLKLRMKYDDGFVAYLNGVKVAESLAPAGPTWNSGSTAPHDDTAAVVFEDFDITGHISELIVGQNVLAIHGLNQALDSSDLLILPELVGEQVEEGMGGTDVINVDTPMATVGGTGWVNVREVFLQGAAAPLDVTWLTSTSWEATVPVQFGSQVLTFEAYDFRGNFIGTDTVTVNSTANNPIDALRITEINYNPSDPTADELASNASLNNDDFEFVEIQNTGTVPIGLAGFRFISGIDFTFPDVALAGGEYGVIVQDADAFALRYGDGVNVIGEVDGGRLSNDGEQLTLADGGGNVVLEVDYDDADLWTEAADGAGATLVMIDPAGTPGDQSNKYYHWRGSTEFGGSPGAASADPIGVVINEVLAHTDPPVVQSDSIELYNTTGASVDIGGWLLSDAGGNLQKYAIPAGTTLAADAYIVFDESHFNPTPLNPGPNDFALSGANGDDVYLVIPDGSGGVTSFVDNVHFGASANGESFGRVPNGAGRLTPTAQLTLGSENSQPRVGPLVISEVNYNPGMPSAAAIAADPNVTSDDLEFVEVHNPTVAAVDLTNWRIRGGVDFDFDDGTQIDAGETLVILSFDPADPLNASRLDALRAHYGLAEDAALWGGYNGQLSNSGERVQLQRPDVPPPEDPTLIPRLNEDEVLYDNLAPWAVTASGGGDSLQRGGPGLYGNAANSWTGTTPSPGTVDFNQVPGDFTGDGTVDATDIDALYTEINAGNGAAEFDLDGNGKVEAADVVFLVENILGTFMGDADLDGKVDAQDLNQVGINWRATAGVGWADGDYSGDDKVDAADLNLLGINWRNGVAPAAASAPPNQRVPRAPLAMAATAQPVTDAIFANENGPRFLFDSRLNDEVLPHGRGSDERQDVLLDLLDTHGADRKAVFANDIRLAQPRRYRQASLPQEGTRPTEASSLAAFSAEVDKLFAGPDIS